MVAGAGRCHVKQLPLGRDHLVQFELVGNLGNSAGKRQHPLIAGKDDDSTKFQALREMHRPDENGIVQPLALKRGGGRQCESLRHASRACHLCVRAAEDADFAQRHAVIEQAPEKGGCGACLSVFVRCDHDDGFDAFEDRDCPLALILLAIDVSDIGRQQKVGHASYLL